MGNDVKAAEKKRLAEALRANLRRRKAARPSDVMRVAEREPESVPNGASTGDH